MHTKINNLLPRELLKEIEPFGERDEIIVILGARQIGKICLLQYIQKKLEEKDKSIFFINLEDIELREVITSAQDLLSYIKALGYKGEHTYLFINEIHYIQKAQTYSNIYMAITQS